LPALSVVNARVSLQAVMPLPQLSPQKAAELVVKHLVNRIQSRKSRMRNKVSRPRSSFKRPYIICHRRNTDRYSKTNSVPSPASTACS
jgi:hypothetical protein